MRQASAFMRENRPNPPSGVPGWTLPAIVVAVILAIGIGYAGYEIGNGKSSAGSDATPTATPSATPMTASTATSTPVGVTPTPTSTPVRKTVAVPAGTGTKAVDKAIVRAEGYLPQAWANMDIIGGKIWAFTATCANTGDGYCQTIFFFRNRSLLGTDTKKPSREILGLSYSHSPQAILVKYANYKPSDPMCCPSRRPVTIAYSWNGSNIVASGTPPGH